MWLRNEHWNCGRYATKGAVALQLWLLLLQPIKSGNWLVTRIVLAAH
jgi:hypothetical protein